ncbi:MAG: S26 family signal peptidase, partial [Dermatophilaceae bacterium]|nr:S26 family signal peptidase [Dermatophilaceae bacterium]
MSQYTGRPEDPTRGRPVDGIDESDDVDDVDEDYDDEPRGFVGTVLAGLKELLIVVVLAMVLSFVVKTWLFQAFYIPSGSMENTLVKDDRVIVSKLTPGPFDLKRGDV